MRLRTGLFHLAWALTLVATPLGADDVRPVQVEIREREPGWFLVRWRVPPAIPAEGIPVPVMPENCIAQGDPTISTQGGNWAGRQEYRCPQGISGQEVGIRYPFPNGSVTTVMRVELLTGERLARQLDPQEDTWLLPAADVDPVSAWLSDSRVAVQQGADHMLSHWVHWALLLALVLLAGTLGSVRFVSAFAGGQLLAVLGTAALGRSFNATAAELCVAVAVLYLAGLAARAPRGAGPVLEAGTPGASTALGIVVLTGSFHGLGLGALLPASAGTGWLAASHLLVIVLGMDAALLLLALALGVVRRFLGSGTLPTWARPAAAYVLGVTSAVAAFSLVATGVEVEAVQGPMILPAVESGIGSGSGDAQVSPQFVDAPVQTFLAIEPFEVRHEVQYQVRDLVGTTDLLGDQSGFIEVADQEALLTLLEEFTEANTVLEIDGVQATGTVDRTGFMTIDLQGVLPRQAPVPEAVEEALVGVTLLYIIPGVPEEVRLTWDGAFAFVAGIPTTIIDPESSRPLMLTADSSSALWRNELVDDAIPTVSQLEVEPARLPVPMASLPFLLGALLLGIWGLRGGGNGFAPAMARVAVAVALFVGPLAEIAVAVPLSNGGVGSDVEARRVLASLLPNVYRALEIRAEEPAYDRLSLVVTGETLTDVYLEHRRALVMEERGGARARVEAVEVTEVRDVEPGADGGFRALASWTVGGNVTHFGHRHFRQNLYEARLELVPVDGVWKIRSVQVIGEERVR